MRYESIKNDVQDPSYYTIYDVKTGRKWRDKKQNTTHSEPQRRKRWDWNVVGKYLELIVYDATEDEIFELVNKIDILKTIKVEKIEGSEKTSSENYEWLSRVNLYT